jgi:hypothetical protein
MGSVPALEQELEPGQARVPGLEQEQALETDKAPGSVPEPEQALEMDKAPGSVPELGLGLALEIHTRNHLPACYGESYCPCSGDGAASLGAANPGSAPCADPAPDNSTNPGQHSCAQAHSR